MKQYEASGTGREVDPKEHRRVAGIEWLEFWSATVLAIATIATAWSAFQGQRWSGVETESIQAGIRLQIEAAATRNEANQLYQYDVQWFETVGRQYLEGEITSDDTLRDPLLREKFSPFVEAWLRTEPSAGDSDLTLPFSDPAYENDLYAESVKLAEDAQKQVDEGLQAQETGDEYIGGTVILAICLFFIGISPGFSNRSMRITLVSLGSIALTGTLFWLATMPIH